MSGEIFRKHSLLCGAVLVESGLILQHASAIVQTLFLIEFCVADGECECSEPRENIKLREQRKL